MSITMANALAAHLPVLLVCTACTFSHGDLDVVWKHIHDDHGSLDSVWRTRPAQTRAIVAGGKEARIAVHCQQYLFKHRDGADSEDENCPDKGCRKLVASNKLHTHPEPPKAVDVGVKSLIELDPRVQSGKKTGSGPQVNRLGVGQHHTHAISIPAY